MCFCGSKYLDIEGRESLLHPGNTSVSVLSIDELKGLRQLVTTPRRGELDVGQLQHGGAAMAGDPKWKIPYR